MSLVPTLCDFVTVLSAHFDLFSVRLTVSEVLKSFWDCPGVVSTTCCHCDIIWCAVSAPCFCVFDCCFIQKFHSTTPLAKLTRNPEMSLVPTLCDFVTVFSTLWIIFS